jgi:hypothetical protein
MIVDLSIPGVGLNASNLVMNGSIRQSDDSRLNFTIAPSGALSYATMGTWSYFASAGVSGFDGAALTGYQTQAGHVPTSGAATFIGLKGSSQGDAKAGGVTGLIWVPSDGGNPTIGGGLSGNAQLNINFATGSVAGQLTNMTVGTAGGSSAWNDVNLSGNLSGASLSGTTSTPGQPASVPAFFPPGMSSAATGTFKGALYGPNATEVGAIWTLSEPSALGGKSALGVIGATKQ